MIFAFIGALASSIMSVFDKVILRRRNLSFRQLLPFSLTTSFILCLFAFPFLGNVDSSFFSPKYLLLFGAMVISSYILNILFVYSMKKEQLCDVEPFVLMDGPLTVIIAAMIFPSERSLLPLVLTLLAASALIISRFNKRHFKFIFKKTTLALLLYVLLVSFQAQFAKVLLEVMTPVALYTFRNGVLAALYWVTLRPKVSSITFVVKRNLVIDGVITFVALICHFYAILYLGIVETTLIFLLAPVLTLGFSKYYLKENFTLKKAIADTIILGCIVGIVIFH
jgi:drug/metabolite transporter (DMT)-like permease